MPSERFQNENINIIDIYIRNEKHLYKHYKKVAGDW